MKYIEKKLHQRTTGDGPSQQGLNYNEGLKYNDFRALDSPELNQDEATACDSKYIELSQLIQRLSIQLVVAE